MLEEAKTMIRVPNHDHIVNFKGISLDVEKCYVLLEFCSFGAINSFLRANSANFRTKLANGDCKEVALWCYQVADAMEFLVKNNIIHVSLLNIRIIQHSLFTHTQSHEMKIITYFSILA